MSNYQELCPVGTNVRIIAPIGSGHEDWAVMPATRDKSQMFIPEGYELVEGIGEVTGYELDAVGKSGISESNRLTYDNLVIVQVFIQCKLVKEWWNKECQQK